MGKKIRPRASQWNPSRVLTGAMLAGALFSCTAFAARNGAFTESVIIFNTVCAKCHEAECSGRLSFEEAFDASTRHILRHYGPASGKQWMQKELFEILNHMKEKCAYYPLQGPVPVKRDWGSEILDKYSTLLERNYFIPLGRLAPGEYRLELELARDARLRVQLISEQFDMAVEECVDSTHRRITLPFRIETAGNYYFRMYPRQPVRLTRLVITATEKTEQMSK